MYKKSLYPLVILVVSLVVLITACQPAPTAPPEAAAPPTTAPVELTKVSLRLPWITNTQFAGPYVALDKGYFKEEGLDVEIRPGGIDKNSITLVAAGEDTFGLHDTGSLLLARAQGMPLITIATFFQKHPGGVFGLKDSGIQTLKDFEGKLIGFQEGGPWMLTKAMMKANGVDINSVKTVTVQYDITPLLEGKIDLMTCYATNEPLVARRMGKEPIVFLPADYGVPTASEALFTTEAYLKDNPKVARGMVRAIQRGWEYAMANKEEAVDIVMKYGTELDKAAEMDQLVAEEAHLMTPEVKESGVIGLMTPEKWETIYKVLREQGALETEVDYMKAFTTEYLK